jgi:hypothetical protein
MTTSLFFININTNKEGYIMKGKTGWIIAAVLAILVGIGGFFIDRHFDNKAATQVEDTTQKGPDK